MYKQNLALNKLQFWNAVKDNHLMKDVSLIFKTVIYFLILSDIIPNLN